MSIETLKYIADVMESLGLPYDFVVWNGEQVPDPYWIGEYAETEPLTEDGLQESTFILTGTTRESWLSLEQAKTKIKNRFPPVTGDTAILDNGSGVAIFYTDAFPVPAEDGDYKRIQINLRVKEWSVN